MSGCNVIIIGGEGDLAFRKLYPAMCSLENEGLLPADLRIVSFGEATAYPHGGPAHQVLKADDMVLIDTGTSLHGYKSDIIDFQPGDEAGIKSVTFMTEGETLTGI